MERCLVLFILGVCIAQVGVHARTSEQLCVVLPDGSTMIGSTLMTRRGRSIRAFRGIPYAKPPIGDLRFKAPVPIGRLQEELQATKDRNICMQLPDGKVDPHAPTILGSEDCLYLNVYTPFRVNKPLKNLPVMMYIFGGSFKSGDGTSSSYGPDILLDHDTVLVTGNYRVGPFGFLSTGQEDCPGNFGLKDQVQILRWIHENIIAFGGDPNCVTIFGQSAGAASVTFLMESPLTEGLIKRAIAMSGTNISPFETDADAVRRITVKFAESMNCSFPGNWTGTIDCLRDVSAEDITAATTDINALVPFPPVIEPADLPGAVVIANNRNRQPRRALSIPLMTSITHDEFVDQPASLVYDPSLFKEFATNLRSELPSSLLYSQYGEDAKKYITDRLIYFYFNNEPLDAKKHFRNLTNVWLIVMTYSVLPLYKTRFSNALPTKKDQLMREILPELFVNFARTGNPTPLGTKLPKWHHSKKFPLNFYRIGNHYYEGKPIVGMEYGGLFEERANFWRDLLAELSQFGIILN